jgi:plasmid stabilization system protein ParE
VWILMPRVARPAYRYRKYSNVFRVPIGRRLARAIVLAEGETLEDRLVDAGANEWPVPAEVHLYEAILGTQLGHLAAFEEEAQASDFEELTPQNAALLTRQPGLGRPSPLGVGRRRPFPGQRLFRIRVPRLRLARHANVSVRVDLMAAQPVFRVHVRCSEVLALRISSALARRGPVQVVALMRSRFGPARRARLAAVLAKRLGTAISPEPGAREPPGGGDSDNPREGAAPSRGGVDDRGAGPGPWDHAQLRFHVPEQGSRRRRHAGGATALDPTGVAP